MRRRRSQSKYRWILCVLKGNMVERAIQNCKQQGWEPYYPTFFNEATKRRQALFPGYIMVDCRGDWGPLANTTGISYVVTFGDQPAIVQAHDVKKLKRAENRNGNIVLPKITFKQGDPVKVVSGKMKGLVGFYDGQAEDDRVRVLFSMLGTPSTTVVPAWDVRPDVDSGDNNAKDARPKRKRGTKGS